VSQFLLDATEPAVKMLAARLQLELPAKANKAVTKRGHRGELLADTSVAYSLSNEDRSEPELSSSDIRADKCRSCREC